MAEAFLLNFDIAMPATPDLGRCKHTTTAWSSRCMPSSGTRGIRDKTQSVPHDLDVEVCVGLAIVMGNIGVDEINNVGVYESLHDIRKRDDGEALLLLFSGDRTLNPCFVSSSALTFFKAFKVQGDSVDDPTTFLVAFDDSEAHYLSEAIKAHTMDPTSNGRGVR
ncbi:hypothetical protein V8G54_024840 [Vigna mungo]|uniref:Uncharacterized protein n=1 Tax=Vigna mungo TaxID=3915 RepID=A0AAQ3N6M0_VIGMU